jgi:bifunctional DNA-binding transcriptional regulator/antitoxin component of YhaV-PrlF toxin-antitoxin module
MEFTAVIDIFESDLWFYHFYVPDYIVEELSKDGNKRMNCTVNNSLTYPCALMPDGKKAYFITINKEYRKKLGLEKGSIITVDLEKDESKYGMPICEEFEELLIQDDLGSHFFHRLSIGKQRSLLYIVNKFKSSELRLTKAIIILNYLKSASGKLDYKELNEAFKRGL